MSKNSCASDKGIATTFGWRRSSAATEDPDDWHMEEPGENGEEESALPITVVFQTPVRKDMVAEYSKWHEGINAVSGSFEGYRGYTLIEGSSDQPGVRNFYTISRWATVQDAARWKKSAERHEWLEKRQKFAFSGSKGVHSSFGLGEYPYIKLCGDDDEMSWMCARWESFKVCLLTWLLVWKLVTLWNVVVYALPGFDTLSLNVQIGIVTLLVALSMHYAVFHVAFALAKKARLLR
eukprot:TRINITY_DN81497_c0_g1_i1.p1 TRINITY_DN81497_c0_g1~~TRINITY_DN81497_c0_g1_i1.p1  ORF type:complete len:249 (+),score=31.68 TRINITY_DN81497_c0_g1_i1:42-749(+)